MFKKNLSTVEPWKKVGRWYHLFVESDGSKNIITKSDLQGVETSGQSIKMPLDFEIVDYKIVDCDVADSKSIDMSFKKYAADSREYVTLNYAIYTYADCYIFGYFKHNPADFS